MATNYNNMHKAAQSNQRTQTHSGGGRHFSTPQNGRGSNGRSPKKSSGGAKVFSTVAIVVGVILLIVAAVLFGKEMLGHKHAADVAGETQQLVSAPAEDTDTPEKINAGIPVVDWEKLYAINKDVVGWLQIPGTNINYAVVQGATNDDYLHKTIRGQEAVEGSIFLDSDSARNLSDKHTILYGHNIQNGSMFHAIASFVDQDFFNQHRTIYFVTPEKNYVLKTLSTYLTDGTDTNVRVFNWGSDEEYKNYVKTRYDKSVIKATDIDLNSVNHLFEFSTCSYSRNDGRTILLATIDENADTKSELNGKPVNNSEGQMVEGNK